MWTTKTLHGPIYIINHFSMNSKQLLFIVLLFLHVHSLFSQCISIELSVTWEMGYDILKKDSVISIPKLNISYRNNCDVNYYFIKPFKSEDYLPIIFCLLLDNTHPEEYQHPNYFKKNKLYGKYTNKNFTVDIDRGEPSYGNGWHICCDTIDDAFEKLYCEYVNCYLSRINTFIRHNNNQEYLLNSKKSEKLDFEPEDMFPEHISGYLNDQFVFLKSGETYIDSYNLVAFKVLEGCYTFFINQSDIKNYVTGSQYDIEAKRFVDQKFELPKIVGEYHRYSGGFNTNKVTVCFGER